ncbi:mucin-5AC-like [Saccostrea echinata]|uniref:mucin-5AC-like n=1 Tax=Saccostrea echinata TaxID=191078 RepID=UPI002A80CB1F|nr:mucin-5AC-like [Saccostrea echinata]
MPTKNRNIFVCILILITCIAEHATCLMDFPTELRDQQFHFKSNEGNGNLYFYTSHFLIIPPITIGVSQHRLWDFIASKTNFMAFRSQNKVTINSEEKYIYKCWLYKRENSSLYFYFPMTSIYEGQRVYPSTDENLDICDFCTHTDTELYVLHKNEVPCGCTPKCSELTIENSCTGKNFDTSSINCLSETSSAITTTIQEASTKEYSEDKSLTTSPTLESDKTTAASTHLDVESTTLLEDTAQATITAKSITASSTTSETTTKSTSDISTAAITRPTLTTEITVPPTTNSVEENTEIKTTEKVHNQENPNVSTTKQSTNLGIDPDALVGIVSGSVVFVYLAAATIGCGCCLFILGRRKRRKKEKESQENLVSNEVSTSQNSFKPSVKFPSVFDRIDE